MPARAAVLPALAVLLLATLPAGPALADESRSIGYTVAEAPPHCGPLVCVHWVATTADAPSPADADGDGVPDFVELTLTSWEAAVTYELTTLGWAPPPGDGTRGGGSDLLDVYLDQRNGQGGAVYETDLSTDGGATAPGFAVADQDFAEYAPFLQHSLVRAIAAHEVNHLLQFGTDLRQEHWFLEASATTTEEPFAPGLNSWVSYARRWGQSTETPIDRFDHAKAYGTGAFLMWLQALHGEDAVADAWRRSRAAGSSPTRALDATIRARGGEGFEEAAFAAFAAQAAEWRRPAMALPDRSLLTDVERVARLEGDGAQHTVELDHLTFALLDVPPPAAADAAELTVAATDGVPGFAALVGRTAEAETGEAEIRVVRVPAGGEATVTLAQPARFARITAAVVNPEALVSGEPPPEPSVDAVRYATRLRLLGVPTGSPAPEPQPPAVEPPPEPLPMLREPTLSDALRTLRVARRVGRAVAVRGLPLRIALRRAAVLTIEVRSRRGTLARATRRLDAGTRTVRVRLPGRRVSRRGRTPITVVVGVRDASGAVTTARRRVVVVP
ncbi:MAG TPA: MXAN_6640 family putative metalloprotease [Solirubrobacteraceae bacterium]|nr:MXAN_6640 family putative metalloprotease [Solirubrobacteraceae bacterium]